MAQGKLLLIGGAEAKQGEREILSTFVQLAGGAQANIYIIPSATEYPAEAGRIYSQVFQALGAAKVTCLPISDRELSNHSGFLPMLEGATGYFFTGGQQARLLDIWQETSAWDVIQKRFRDEDVVICGTSAGAAVMGERVILFSERLEESEKERIVVAEGLGVFEYGIVDQHFSQRSRLDRLLAVVKTYPELLGVGIDEDTAILVNVEKEYFDVLGMHSVTVIDGHRQYRLLKGDRFYTRLRTVIPFQKDSSS